MAKEKKRPSKSAKAASKLLKDSKLLETVKTKNESKTNQSFEPTDDSSKPSAANKLRPEKKRG